MTASSWHELVWQGAVRETLAGDCNNVLGTHATKPLHNNLPTCPDANSGSGVPPGRLPIAIESLEPEVPEGLTGVILEA